MNKVELKEILIRRKEIEAELLDLIDKTNSDFDLEDVKDVIYNEKETDDMQDIIAMLDDGNIENLSNVLEIVTDAWNYFPHKILGGLSPQEKLLIYNQKLDINKKNTGQNDSFDLQPILINKEQYKELLRALAAYQLIKQASAVPDLKTAELGAYITEQGKKFGFERIKMNEMDWFDQINDEVFELLFEYSQEEMWQHLAHILAERDTKQGLNSVENSLLDEEMQSDVYLDVMGKKVLNYLNEFAKNGTKNIKVNL